MENIEPNDSYSKPGFDGRLHYYKLVGSYMYAIAQHQAIHDYKGWLDNINGLFDLVTPFIPDNNKLDEEITKCEKIIDNLGNGCINRSNQLIINRHIEQQLHNLTKSLYKSAKHMLLPISSKTEGTFSEADFLEGSDL